MSIDELLYPKSDNDWDGTFFTCKYARYVRHGSWRGYRCMKDPVPYLAIPCDFSKPNKKCPNWKGK